MTDLFAKAAFAEALERGDLEAMAGVFLAVMACREACPFDHHNVPRWASAEARLYDLVAPKMVANGITVRPDNP